MATLKTTVLTVVLGALCGCSFNEPSPAWRHAEVISIEDQARDAVLSTPTDFTVAIGDDRLAWARLLDFAGRYTKGAPATGYLASAKQQMTSAHYTFYVQKSPRPEGVFSYRISCVPKRSKDASLADQNARNLARYVRDGVLEVSLLKP